MSEDQVKYGVDATPFPSESFRGLLETLIDYYDEPTLAHLNTLHLQASGLYARLSNHVMQMNAKGV